MSSTLQFCVTLLFLTFLLGQNTYVNAGTCPPAFKGKCICGHMTYLERSNQFVVNCTNTEFTDTTILEHLPAHTQILIFTGNHIPELPSNVFGIEDDLDQLRVVDMSNNNIKSVHGKSFHRASKVERLILNYNSISLTVDGGHPRLLTGFPNLKELHLTGAFAKEGTLQEEQKSLGFNQLSSLRDIFESANLTLLVKLHLEQNCISTPIPKDLFCALESLLDLHLGDNWLSADSLPSISCLKKLRFIDLGRNRLHALSNRAMAELDTLPQRKQNLMIDLSGNPLDCSQFCAGSFASWLRDTNVTIRNKDVLRCINSNSHPCAEIASESKTAGGHEAAAIILGILLAILIIMLVVAMYLNRTSLSYKLNPIVDSVSRKVRYTSIEHPEEQEMNV